MSCSKAFMLLGFYGPFLPQNLWNHQFLIQTTKRKRLLPNFSQTSHSMLKQRHFFTIFNSHLSSSSHSGFAWGKAATPEEFQKRPQKKIFSDINSTVRLPLLNLPRVNALSPRNTGTWHNTTRPIDNTTRLISGISRSLTVSLAVSLPLSLPLSFLSAANSLSLVDYEHCCYISRFK